MKILFTVFTVRDWIVLSLIILVIVVTAIYALYTWLSNLYNRKFKKNCYNCIYWHLDNVASCGDGSAYSCRKHREVSTFNRYHRMIKFSERDFYTKCDDFESKYNPNKLNDSKQQDNQA